MACHHVKGTLRVNRDAKGNSLSALFVGRNL
jgi:hypothetical protein